MNQKRYFFLLAALLMMIQGAWAQGLEGTGSKSDPFKIQSDADWEYFAGQVNSGANNYSGKYIKLTTDIPVNEMVGDSNHSFKGTFDGAGHQLDLALGDDSEDGNAPFRFIEGATIKNVHVTGIVGGKMHTSGLVGSVHGSSNLIENCRVSAQVQAKNSGTHAGGFVGHATSSTLSVIGCLFDGRLYTDNKSGTYFGAIVGWSATDAKITVKDCVAKVDADELEYFEHVALNYFNYGGSPTSKTVNCYHNFANVDDNYKMYPIEFSGDNVDVTITGTKSYYNQTGITAYEGAVKLDGDTQMYSSKTNTLNFTVNPRFGSVVTKITPTNCSISGNNPYDLTVNSTVQGTIKVTIETTTYPWEGSGESYDPFLIKSTEDWAKLANLVNAGATFSGNYFKLTEDVNTNGVMVGSYGNGDDYDDILPFSGVFDGNYHKLTFNKESSDAVAIAPFQMVKNATIKNLTIDGQITSSSIIIGGFVGMAIEKKDVTTLENCRSNVKITSNYPTNGGFGGFVGMCNSDSISIKNCTFNGELNSNPFGGLAGFVGIATGVVNFNECVFAPAKAVTGAGNTFANFPQSGKAIYNKCYYTHRIGTENQGVGVFKEIKKNSNDITIKYNDEPSITINGEKYYAEGTCVELTYSGSSFNHWVGTNAYFTDCTKKNGNHYVINVNGQPELSVSSSNFTDDDTFDTLNGVIYKLLKKGNYLKYLDDFTIQKHGWYWDGDNLCVKDKEGDPAYIMAVTGYDASKFNGSDENGVVILNDAVDWYNHHTHLGVIAPRAFANCSQLKKVYFRDCETMWYANYTDFDFMIADEAFLNCTNLEQISMKAFIESGDNHWGPIKPNQVFYLSPTMLEGCKGKHDLRIAVEQSIYQSFFFDDNWRNYWDRIGIFEDISADMKEYGAVYTWMMNDAQTEYLRNYQEDYDKVLYALQPYMANHYNVVPSELLATLKEDGNSTIYYTKITGADASYLSSHDGVMKIYNDVGTNYAYKTLVVTNGAFKDCKELKKIEFHQTNGNGQNSYSDLKILLENNIFKGCDNLKELVMYYYIKDGDDHWESLGPQDVIPGNNLFGIPDNYLDPNLTEEEATKSYVPKGFRIVVSPNRYQEFINDVNWLPYASYIMPEDYDLPSKTNYEYDRLTYRYVANEGVLPTDQVVTQDWSLWNIPILALEAFMAYESIVQFFAGAPGAAVADEGVEVLQEVNQNGVTAGAAFRQCFLADQSGDAHQVTNALHEFWGQDITQWGINPGIHEEFDQLAALGAEAGRPIMSAQGVFQPINMASAYTLQQARTACRLLGQLYQKTFPNHAAQIANVAGNVIQNAGHAAFFRNLLKAAGPLANVMAIGMESLASLGPDAPSSSLKKGMRDNIIANNYCFTVGPMVWTPTKNLIYHTYISSAPDTITTAKIYAGSKKDVRTIAIGKRVFQNKSSLKNVEFWENLNVSDSRTQCEFVLTIPDSAFANCTALETVDLRLKTKNKGTKALGPDNFILLGDSIFNGCDTTKLKIIVADVRKDDFLNNPSWKPYARFFDFRPIEHKEAFSDFGVRYAYVYENNVVKKEHNVGSNTIEHVYALGPDDSYIKEHEGGMALYNDVGVWNNYQLDYINEKAFSGDTELKTVSFWDVNGLGWTGDVYTGFDVTLNDSCFINCPNLEYVDLLYLVTDGDNHIVPMTPTMLKIGKGVFNNSPKAKFKMTEAQARQFGADDSWKEYSNFFYPCVVKAADEALVDALTDLRYYTPCKSWDDWSSGYWDGWLDLSRVHKLGGFSYFNGKLKGNTSIKSFPGFKQMGVVGLDYVGDSWFEGCTNLSSITLPETIKSIKSNAFKGCTSLTEMEIPAATNEITNGAFDGCTSLNTIRVLGTEPATIGSSKVFDKHSGLRIYVPDASLNKYLTQWSEYKDYIKPTSEFEVKKYIVVKTAGTLAEELGLGIEEDNVGAFDSQIRYLSGNYAKYDSLTIVGPLNGKDFGVIRYLAGADVWDSDPTDGCLRYLNIYGVDIKKDDRWAYNCNGIDEYIEKDNWIGDYLFENCTALQTVILPKSATEMGENIFEDASSLKRVCIGDKLTKYDSDILQNLTSGIEEVVFLTESTATSSSSDPWENPIMITFVPNSQLGDYLGQVYLTRQTAVRSMFKDDAVMHAFADHGQFFPSEYISINSVEDFFSDNTAIKEFEEFQYFSKVTALENTFAGCTNLASISLPDSIKSISASAFTGCENLMDIYITTDSIPTLEEDAFKDLKENPNGFRIHVPKRLAYRYRDAWAQYEDHIVGESTNSNDIYVVRLTEPNTLADSLGLKLDVSKKWAPLELTYYVIKGITGDYSKYKKLKVIGPISGGDLIVLTYLAGYTPWENTGGQLGYGRRNYSGVLEYLDLYEAEVKASEYKTWYGGYNGMYLDPDYWQDDTQVENDNELPSYSFYKCYNLKTLILPKTLKKIGTRAFLGSQYLETVVLGDDLEDLEWSAFDDCAYLCKVYIMSNKKVDLDAECAFLKSLNSHYAPSLDAFYVRPSQLTQYRSDSEINSDYRLTNAIVSGEFDEDESFLAFARHAAATADDLSGVDDITDWFNNYPGITNLNPLRYTSIDSIRVADVDNLTKLKYIALPMTLEGIEKDAFKPATGLRYVDALFTMGDGAKSLANGGFKKAGINIDSAPWTLAYVNSEYGTTTEHNVVVVDSTGFNCEYYDIVDGEDYCVPYAFNTKGVGTTRVLGSKDLWYSSCLPYEMPIPAGLKAYEMFPNNREHEIVYFKRVQEGNLVPFKPYILLIDQANIGLGTDVAQTMPLSSAVSGLDVDTYGYRLRGTIKKISNKDAAEMGAYVLQSDHKYHPITTDNPNGYIPAYRNYFVENGLSFSNGFSIQMIENEAEGIEYIGTIEEDGTVTYYDLSGRRLPGKPNKGVYIKNNKKEATH